MSNLNKILAKGVMAMAETEERLVTLFEVNPRIAAYLCGDIKFYSKEQAETIARNWCDERGYKFLQVKDFSIGNDLEQSVHFAYEAVMYAREEDETRAYRCVEDKCDDYQFAVTVKNTARITL